MEINCPDGFDANCFSWIDEESRLEELVRRDALSGISAPEALSKEQNDLLNTVAQAFRVPTR